MLLTMGACGRNYNPFYAMLIKRWDTLSRVGVAEHYLEVYMRLSFEGYMAQDMMFRRHAFWV
jgi:hypothetical protein